MIRPLRRVHRGKRTHALAMLILGLAAMYAISRSMPHTQAGVPAARGLRGGVEAGDRRYLIDEANQQRAERAS